MWHNPCPLKDGIYTVFTSIQETLDCFLIENTLMYHDYIYIFWVNRSFEALMLICGKGSELQYQAWNKSISLSFSLSPSTQRQIGVTHALRWQEGFEPQSHFHLPHFPSDENHLSCSVVISRVCIKPHLKKGWGGCYYNALSAPPWKALPLFVKYSYKRW